MEATKVSDIKEEYLTKLKNEDIIRAWEMDTQKIIKSFGDVPISNNTQTVTLYDKYGKKHSGSTDDYILVNNKSIVVVNPDVYHTIFPSVSSN